MNRRWIFACVALLAAASSVVGRAQPVRRGKELFSPVGASPQAAPSFGTDTRSRIARIVTPLEDMFRGDRRYEALDLEGHRWHFAERLPEIQA